MRLEDIEESELRFYGLGGGAAFDSRTYWDWVQAQRAQKVQAAARPQYQPPPQRHERLELGRVREALRQQEAAARQAQALVEQYQQMLVQQTAEAQSLQDVIEQQSFVAQYQPSPAPERQVQIIEDVEDLPLAFIRKLKPVQGQVIE